MFPSVYVVENDEYLSIAFGEYLLTQDYLISIFGYMGKSSQAKAFCCFLGLLSLI